MRSLLSSTEESVKVLYWYMAAISIETFRTNPLLLDVEIV